MTKELWLNLPVKDIKRSREFFSKIGFSFNEQHSSDSSLAMLVGNKGSIMMLFEESIFKTFTQHNLTDTAESVEVLISFDAESRDEIDDIANKVKEAGGNLYAPPSEIQGWMYGGAFADPDGHRWNMLHMDMSKMPKG